MVPLCILSDALSFANISIIYPKTKIIYLNDTILGAQCCRTPQIYSKSKMSTSEGRYLRWLIKACSINLSLQFKAMQALWGSKHPLSRSHTFKKKKEKTLSTVSQSSKSSVQKKKLTQISLPAHFGPHWINIIQSSLGKSSGKKQSCKMHVVTMSNNWKKWNSKSARSNSSSNDGKAEDRILTTQFSKRVGCQVTCAVCR